MSSFPAVLPRRVPAPVVPALPRRRRRGLGKLLELRDEIRERLAAACALEHPPPPGFSIASATRSLMVTGTMYRWYFRTRSYGLEHLPRGRFLLASNHGSHALAWDGANLLSACLLDGDPPRLVHAMADRGLMQLPVLGAAARSVGAVAGDRATCVRLLRAGAAVLTFPEGTRAHERTFRQRYELAPFGHGFIRVALTAHAPIVPVAVIGCVEEAPLLANPAWLRRLARVPVAPITPTLVIPLPVRYRLHFGAPIHLTGPLTSTNVARSVDQVRAAMLALIEEGRSRRRHVFW